jgi:hypothetical protein
MNTNSFIFGIDQMPNWFNKYSDQVNYIYTNNQLDCCEVRTNKGISKAFVGDTILEVNNNLVIVGKADAKKYGLE